MFYIHLLFVVVYLSLLTGSFMRTRLLLTIRLPVPGTQLLCIKNSWMDEEMCLRWVWLVLPAISWNLRHCVLRDQVKQLDGVLGETTGVFWSCEPGPHGRTMREASSLFCSPPSHCFIPVVCLFLYFFSFASPEPLIPSQNIMQIRHKTYVILPSCALHTIESCNVCSFSIISIKKCLQFP